MRRYETSGLCSRDPRQPIRGFTLIEILIVVILLGILASMVVPRFVNISNDVEETQIKHQLTEVRKQLKLYQFKQNQYPADLTTLVTAGYIDKMPTHPSPGNYNYNPATGAITSSRDATW